LWLRPSGPACCRALLRTAEPRTGLGLARSSHSQVTRDLREDGKIESQARDGGRKRRLGQRRCWYEPSSTWKLRQRVRNDEHHSGRDAWQVRRAHSAASVYLSPITLPFSRYSFAATETIDDLTATELAARSHPNAPPHLPSLPFTDHTDELAGILYAPELVAPNPTIWLPSDRAGVARGEAYDLQRYHGLRSVVDVRSAADVVGFRDQERSRPNGGSARPKSTKRR
jgi:hypothetical protein